MDYRKRKRGRRAIHGAEGGKEARGTSLRVQWIRICLPKHRTSV